MKDEPGADRAGASPGRNRTDKGIKCFNCHRYGHMSMNCPDKANFYCGDRLGRSVVRVSKVEGAMVSEVVLDTGCSRTMVRRDLVPEENLLPGEGRRAGSAAGRVFAAGGELTAVGPARVDPPR